MFGVLYSDIPQPEDERILLKDILEKDVDKKYCLSEKGIAFVTNPIRLKKSYTSINGEKALPILVNVPSKWLGTFINDNSPIQLNLSIESTAKQPFQQNRVYSDEGKIVCLDTDKRKNVYTNNRIRRLTPLECCRLQTIPEWYKWDCSDTQIYTMIGNGWTVKVIMHILSYLSFS